MPDITPGSCPHCGVINRETELVVGEHEGAEPGDIMVCEHCAGVSIYVGHGAARKPNELEQNDLMQQHDIVFAVFQAQLGLMQ